MPVIASNFTFATESSHHVKDLVTMTDDTIVFISLCFCEQKNNNNGQSLTYSQRRDTTWLCPTQAGLNIIRQVHCLNTPSDKPAIVYRDPTTGHGS